MDDRLAAYEASLTAQRARATVYAYVSSARRFERYLAERGWFIANFPSSAPSDWVAEVARGKANTAKTYWWGLKRYLEFLASHGVATAAYEPPKLPREHREVPTVLTEEQLALFDRLCAGMAAGNEPARSALRLLALCSLRVNELCTLRMEDLQVVDGGVILTVRAEASKGNAREVPTLDRFREVLGEYLRVWRRGRISRWLFPSPAKGDHHLRPTTIQKYFRRIRKKAGLPKTTTPHTMRRTRLTLMHQAGVDTLTLQKIAGHKSIATTGLYVVPSRQTLLDAANRPTRR